MPNHIGRVPGLDGLRCVAVGTVVLAHTNIGFLGGSLGVDLFFVISGFLITSLLLQEREQYGKIDVPAFYARRALRLFPALAATLLLVLVLVAVTGTNLEYTSIVVVLPAVALYVGNWVAATGHSLGYLAHTWSLAIEEQFYLLWPAAFMLLTKRPSPARAVAGVIAAVIIMRAAIVLAFDDPSGLENWTILRLDALLIGALLAMTIATPTVARIASNGPALLAAGVLAAMMIANSAASVMATPLLELGGFDVVALTAAVLIAHVVLRPEAPISRALSAAPLVAIGKVSYGIYLFHYPIFMFVQSRDYTRQVDIVLEYGLTAAAVIASWVFIEQPALRRKLRFSRGELRVPEAEPKVSEPARIA